MAAGERLVPFYGTGTLTITDQSGAGLTITNGTNWYIKIGTLVICNIRISFPATASAATVLLGGLPFTSVNAAQGANLFGPIASGAAFVTANATTFSLINGAGGNIVNSTLTGGNFQATIIYQANS